MERYLITALYKFVRLPDFELLREPLLNCMRANEVKGTILLASEGLNGTISGPQDGITAVLNHLQADDRFNPLDIKQSWHDDIPFHRSKVKLKREIVTMGVEGIDPNHSVGTYIEPEDWNALIERDDVVLIDTRNYYEVAIGRFKNAIDPKTDNFREFPAFAEQSLAKKKGKKIAMYCTGGIRCEKSTAFLKQQGFDEVFHLKGGILNYLEKIPRDESLWEGDCFVFDDRVAVDHNLEKGRYDQCHACRHPITEEEKTHPDYEPGVSCPRCIGTASADQIARYRERQRQVRLAQARGEAHIGEAAREVGSQRRKAKHSKREAS